MAGQPRTHDGRFAPGYFRWVRPDGQWRWIYYPRTEDLDLREYRWLSDEGRRVFRELALIVVCAFLIWWLW